MRHKQPDRLTPPLDLAFNGLNVHHRCIESPDAWHPNHSPTLACSDRRAFAHDADREFGDNWP